MITGVYKIANSVNGKVYVGSTSVSFRVRWKTHRELLRTGKHRNKHLQAAWNKYGEHSFEFKVVERCGPSECLKREQHWIDELRSADSKYGYNYCPAAGSWLGAKHSRKTRNKIKKLWLRPGHREAVSAKNRLAATKQWSSPENRRKMSEIKSRQNASPKLRRRISRTLKRLVKSGVKIGFALSGPPSKASLEKMTKTRQLQGVLTEAIVSEARRLRRAGWTYRSLQERYGCGFITIYKAVKGITWRHVKC